MSKEKVITVVLGVILGLGFLAWIQWEEKQISLKYQRMSYDRYARLRPTDFNQIQAIVDKYHDAVFKKATYRRRRRLQVDEAAYFKMMDLAVAHDLKTDGPTSDRRPALRPAA